MATRRRDFETIAGAFLRPPLEDSLGGLSDSLRRTQPAQKLISDGGRALSSGDHLHSGCDHTSNNFFGRKSPSRHARPLIGPPEYEGKIVSGPRFVKRSPLFRILCPLSPTSGMIWPGRVGAFLTQLRASNRRSRDARCLSVSGLSTATMSGRMTSCRIAPTKVAPAGGGKSRRSPGGADRDRTMYNTKRPHSALGRRSRARKPSSQWTRGRS